MVREMPLIHPDDRVPVTSTTRHRDYILTSYDPVVPPAGRLQPVSLLTHLLRAHGWLEEAWPVCERLRDALGADETVWGFKWGPRGTAIEFYYYNFTQNEQPNPVSVASVARALGDSLAFRVSVDEKSPYFMWSFEITADGVRRGHADDPRIYLGSGDRARKTCGFSYHVSPEGYRMENHYWFYPPKVQKELDDVYARLRYSPRAGTVDAGRALIPKALERCHTICYAVKPGADGLYFARITTPELRDWIAERQPEVAAMLTEHAEDFAHLRWDLGFDFAGTPSSTSIDIHKYAIHGVF